MRNALGKTTAQRRWTQSAIDCYERGGICKDCQQNMLESQKCMMKATVLELVRVFGIPRAEGESNEQNR